MTILSIITINRNNVAGLQRTVESLRSLKSYGDIVQLICIDGDSCDGSVHFAKSFYSQSSLLVERDNGPYDAMNKGLLLAEGRFSFWLNSGDEFLPACFPELITILSRSLSSIVCCGTIMTDPLTQNACEKYSGSWQLPLSSPNHQSTFIQTAAAKAAGGYTSRYKIASDRDLLLRILLHTNSLEEHRLLVSKYYYGGISSNYVLLQQEHLAISLSYGLISRSEYCRKKFKIYAKLIADAFMRLLWRNRLLVSLNANKHSLRQ